VYPRVVQVGSLRQLMHGDVLVLTQSVFLSVALALAVFPIKEPDKAQE
jgi:hypothetical protein